MREAMIKAGQYKRDFRDICHLTQTTRIEYRILDLVEVEQKKKKRD